MAQTDHPGPIIRPGRFPESPPPPCPGACLASKALDAFGLLFSRVSEIPADVFCSVFFQLSRSVWDILACRPRPAFSSLQGVSGRGQAPRPSSSSHLGERGGGVPSGALARRAPRGVLRQLCPCTRGHVVLSVDLRQDSPSHRCAYVRLYKIPENSDGFPAEPHVWVLFVSFCRGLFINIHSGSGQAANANSG